MDYLRTRCLHGNILNSCLCATSNFLFNSPFIWIHLSLKWPNYYNPPETVSAGNNFYHPPRKLWGINVFTRICLFTRGRVLCDYIPALHQSALRICLNLFIMKHVWSVRGDRHRTGMLYVVNEIALPLKWQVTDWDLLFLAEGSETDGRVYRGEIEHGR